MCTQIKWKILEEMDRFIDAHKLSNLNQEHINNLKNITTKASQFSDRFTAEFSKLEKVSNLEKM